MTFTNGAPAMLIALAIGTGIVLLASPLLWPRNSQPPTTKMRTRPNNAARLRRLLDEAGCARVNVGAFVAASGAVSWGLAASVLLISPVFVLAVCAGLVGAGAPTAFLIWRRSRRARERAALWPDVVDTLISLVRSGHSLVDSIVQLGATMPPSIGGAALRFGLAVSSSANIEKCLDELKADWSDPAGDRIVETLKVTRDVGGTHLTSVLRELSTALRKNLALRREIDARQSWIRVAAGIGAAAPWAVVLLLSTRSEAARAYGSGSGAVLILGGLIVTAVAYVVMLRIGRVAPERRWFA